MLAVQPQLRRPMFFEAHRLSVFTPRALDVDVVLDLMIHDLDIVLTFANSPVREVRAVGLPILSPKVDIANVRVEFESGCVANFTASRVSTERVRKLRFFEPRQYVSIDYARQDLLVIRLDPRRARSCSQPARLSSASYCRNDSAGVGHGAGGRESRSRHDCAICEAAKIDPGLVAAFLAKRSGPGSLVSSSPRSRPANRCAWKSSRFSIQSAPAVSRGLRPARDATPWLWRWRFRRQWSPMLIAPASMISSNPARRARHEHCGLRQSPALC